MPDRNGELADVAPGFDTAEEYRADRRYFGALIGRYANRIARGRFTLDGIEYELPLNDGPNHLHGGPHGFNTIRMARHAVSIEMTRSARCSVVESHGGDQGYPGTLRRRVTYTLTTTTR